MAAPTNAIDICNRALKELHELDTLPGDALTNPDGKAAILCAQFYDDARREVLRMGPWTCVSKRLALASDVWAASTAYAADDLIYGFGAVWKCSTAGTSSATEPTTPGSWAASTAVSLGDRIYADRRIYECTTAGTSDADEPTWPASGTVTDGTVVWTLITTLTDGTVVWTFQYEIIEEPGDNYMGTEYSFPVPADYIRSISVTDEYGRALPFQHEAGIMYADYATPILVYVPDHETVARWDSLLVSAITMYLASKIAYPLTGSHEDEIAFAQACGNIVDEAIKKSKREQKNGPEPAVDWYPGLFHNQRIPPR